MKLSGRILSSKGDHLNRLWVKPEASLRKDCSIAFEAIAGKLSQDGEKIESRLFSLKQGRYLCYKKLGRKSKFKGALDLRWTSSELIRLPRDSIYQTQGFEFTIRVTKGQKFTHIFVKNQTELEAWRSALVASGTFMQDFECLYSILEPIGQGSYGEVN